MDKTTVLLHARTALDKAGNSRDAADLLYEEALADRNLLVAIAEQELRTLCRNLIWKVSASTRAAVWNKVAATDTPSRTPTVRVLGQAIANSLFNFTLPNGMRLADAKAVDLEEAIRVYDLRIKDSSQKRDFLIAVREALPDDNAVVGRCLTEDDLNAFQNGTKQAA